MAFALKKDESKYTWQDYKDWPDEERWEIIDGFAYNMSPAPSLAHQRISSNLHGTIFTQREKLGNCSLFQAPTDVVLDDHNIVQPDILIVCDKNKLTKQNIQGAPDVIFEILSPATGVKDRREKWRLYEQFGVREYILVYPDLENLERYILQDGRYGRAEIFNHDEPFDLKTLEISMNLWEIFEREVVT